jgi:hypothetical protein
MYTWETRSTGAALGGGLWHKGGRKEKRDLPWAMAGWRFTTEIPLGKPATKFKRDSSLHRPTRSQEANAKEKGVGLFRSE